MNPGKIYLAGPMSGYPQNNSPLFCLAAQRLRLAGYDIISPAELDIEGGFNPCDSPTREQIQDFLRRDLRVVLRCESIALLPGWRRSAGATLELAVAERTGLQVYEVTEDFELKPLRSSAIGYYIEFKVTS